MKYLTFLFFFFLYLHLKGAFLSTQHTFTFPPHQRYVAIYSLGMGVGRVGHLFTLGTAVFMTATSKAIVISMGLA